MHKNEFRNTLIIVLVVVAIAAVVTFTTDDPIVVSPEQQAAQAKEEARVQAMVAKLTALQPGTFVKLGGHIAKFSGLQQGLLQFHHYDDLGRPELVAAVVIARNIRDEDIVPAYKDGAVNPEWVKLAMRYLHVPEPTTSTTP